MIKYIIAFMLIATQAMAATVNIGNDLFLTSGDNNTALLLTREQMVVKVQEMENELNNTRVLTYREIEARVAAIDQIKILLETPIEAIVDETIYPDVNSGSGINW